MPGAAGPGFVRRALTAAALLALASATGLTVLVGGDDQAPEPHRATVAPAAPSGPDPQAVIDAVHHRISPVAGEGNALAVDDPSYRAVFDPGGFALALPRTGDGFGVSLSAARRGGRSLDVARTSWRSDANVARRAVADGIEERVTARSGDVEWDVVLNAAPPGAGPLRLEAALEGSARAPVRLAHGLRFRLPGGADVRVGEVVVRDALGRVVHRALPEATGTRLVIDVPAAVLHGATYPVTVDPVVGPERKVDAPTPASANQRDPAVAFDGTNFLVVWSDGRLTPGAPDIFGTRVTPSGTVLDPSGFAVSTAAGSQGQPAVAFDGTNYLVVWGDTRADASGDVYGARVSPSGSVVDANAFPIGAATNSQGNPAAAFNGNTVLVAWTDFRSGTADIFGAEVDTITGSGLGDFPISTAANGQSAPAVAFDSTNWFVTWTDQRSGSDIFGTRVDEFGGVLDGTTTGVAVSTATNTQSDPTVAFDGANYLVAWQDSRSGTPDIFGTRVSPAGAVLDGVTTGFAISTATGAQTLPAVAFDGTNHLVAWQDARAGGNDVFGARVRPAGAVVDPVATGIAISTASGSQTAPSLVDGGNGASFVVWADTRAGTDDVFGARVSQSGSVVDGATEGIAVSTVALDRGLNAVAFDGTNYLVAWEENFGTDTQVRAARVTPAGAVLDPISIALSPVSVINKRPAVAFDGTNYLVVWDEFRPGPTIDIRGTRVTPGGAVLDPAGIAVSAVPGVTNLETDPAIAFDGTNYLVVWTDSRPGSTTDIFGTRVTPAGTVLDGPTTGIPISTAATNQAGPALAFDGTNYLVVWGDARSGPSDIFGTRVSPAGSVLDGAATGFAVATAANLQFDVAVAFDGTNHLAAWTDSRSGSGNDIFGTRISPAGSILDGVSTGIPISTAPKDQNAPAVAAHGPFLVAWRDRRLGNTFDDVYGARVAGNGAVQDPSGFAISILPVPEGSPALATAPGDDWFVAYPRFEPAADTNSIFTRLVSPK